LFGNWPKLPPLEALYDRKVSPESNFGVPQPVSARSIIVVGIIALAASMGIGRFAFTPLLPLMLRDGTIDASTGADWSAVNYGGYLIGALTASRMGRHMLRNLHAALLVVISTALAAFIQAALRLPAACGR